MNMSSPFPKRQNLDSSKFREFADYNVIRDKNGRKFSKWEENTVEKGEIARYEKFLLFPQCFQLQTRKNQGLFGKGLTEYEKVRVTFGLLCRPTHRRRFGPFFSTFSPSSAVIGDLSLTSRRTSLDALQAPGQFPADGMYIVVYPSTNRRSLADYSLTTSRRIVE